MQLLKEDRLPYVTKLHAFKLMRTLAGASRQVPNRYLVGTFAQYKVEKNVIAIGWFGDIRRGRFNGIDVAVKTVRVSLFDDIDAVQEVGQNVTCYHFSTTNQRGVPSSGLLQGMRSLDEHVSP